MSDYLKRAKDLLSEARPLMQKIEDLHSDIQKTFVEEVEELNKKGIFYQNDRAAHFNVALINISANNEIIVPLERLVKLLDILETLKNYKGEK